MSRLLEEISENNDCINATLRNISRVRIYEYYDIFQNSIITGKALHKFDWKYRNTSYDFYLDRYSIIFDQLKQFEHYSRIYTCVFPDIDDFDFIESPFFNFDSIYNRYTLYGEGYHENKNFRMIIE